MRAIKSTGAVILGFMIGVLALVPGSPAWAQLKPELDAKLPAYQPTKQISGSLLIAGSDTMHPLTEAWAAELRRLYPSVTATVKSGGSGAGLAPLFEGKAQAAAMSRKIRQTGSPGRESVHGPQGTCYG